jgi:hypothetical protein
MQYFLSGPFRSSLQGNAAIEEAVCDVVILVCREA